MAYITDSFSSYPHSTTFGPDGGEMFHTSDGFKITVPQGAISAGDAVEITVGFENLGSGLPPQKPSEGFEKVSRLDQANDKSGYKITVEDDYEFNSGISIRFWKSNSSGMSIFKVYCTTGDINPTNWLPRNGAPWSESFSVFKNYVTLQTIQVGKPAIGGGDPSEYFVVGGTK